MMDNWYTGKLSRRGKTSRPDAVCATREKGNYEEEKEDQARGKGKTLREIKENLTGTPIGLTP
jgi:hypothetical protein